MTLEHAARHGQRRHARSARRRLSSLFGGRALVRSALRENAVRSGAAGDLVLEAFQITHDPFYAKIARSTLDYVLRDMTHPDGGFYSAEDADSVIDPANPKEKGEGAFYIWTAAELKQALADSSRSRRYGVEPNGNVPHDPHGEFTGKNILYLRESLDDATEAELVAG